MGSTKSTLFPGHGYYVPSDKGWLKLHERRFIPPCNRPDAIEFDSEEKFMDYVKNRDKTNGMLVYILEHIYFCF